MPEWKAIVGEKVFSHESGIHADGVLKYPGNYEGYDPAEVGLSRHMVIGKHSGRHGLQDRLRELNIDLDPCETDAFLARVRNIAQGKKRPLSDNDLVRLYDADRKVA